MADSIYWASSVQGTIQVAPLDGSGPVQPLYGPANVGLPYGVAIDPAEGLIYWTDFSARIQVAPLDGSGPIQSRYSSADGLVNPYGVAIDRGARRIYWTDYGNHTVRGAPLAGGGPVTSLYDYQDGVRYPSGVAIDAASGRIYWSSRIFATISGAPLTGSGPIDTLYVAGDGVSGPVGVAIDPAAGRIYWTNYADGTIRDGPLGGHVAAHVLYDSASGVWAPFGAAIDPDPTVPAPERLEIGGLETAVGGWLGRAVAWVGDLFSRPSGPPARIYWCNTVSSPANPNDNVIRYAPLAGAGPFTDVYRSNQGVSLVSALAVLRAPLGAGAPTISRQFVRDEGPAPPWPPWEFGGARTGRLGGKLSCSPGTWAPDQPAFHLYRAPRSFAYQWMLDGTDIGGATGAEHTPGTPGSYTCRVTATNRAGSATQTSAALTVS